MGGAGGRRLQLLPACAQPGDALPRSRERRQLPGAARAGGVRQWRPAGARARRGPGQGRAAGRPCRHRVRGGGRGVRHDRSAWSSSALFAFIVLRGLLRLLGEADLFVILAATGLVASFGLQAFVNMASTLHLIPTKGMTLPFISYGGSSVLAVALGHGHAAGADPQAAQRRIAVRGPAVRPVVIAAGGTGGHFFPAEALAGELLAARPARGADDRCALRRAGLADLSPGRNASCCAAPASPGAGRRAACGRWWRWPPATLQARAPAGGCDAAARGGLRRLSGGGAGAGGAAAAAAAAGGAARTERRAGPGQPAAGAASPTCWR